MYWFALPQIAVSVALFSIAMVMAVTLSQAL
jgi:hypothetical protein